MIQIYTALTMTPSTQSKRVVMEMDATDAFALATMLINLDPADTPPAWEGYVSELSRQLIDRGNACRA
jgi:hypothetical protein